MSDFRDEKLQEARLEEFLNVTGQFQSGVKDNTQIEGQ